MFRQFDSVSALANWAHESVPGSCDYRTAVDAEFYGQDTWGQLLHKANCGGEETNVEAARLMAEKFAYEFDSVASVWNPSVMGAYPCVPEALIGMPESMRKRENTLSALAPIKVWIALNSSGTIPAKAIIARGTGILALCLALEASGRAVEIWGYIAQDGKEDGETVIAFQVSSTPLSLSEACFVFCNPGWARRIMYASTQHLNQARGGMPATYDNPYGADYAAKLAAKTGAHCVVRRPHDLEKKQLINSPDDWVKAQAEALKVAIQAQIEAGA
jgi:hypothetical protein